ncbi:protein kinase domain-containing protein [Actinokineospora sp.]|uniref:protein kinase domain-containing protein n=1 Tax=Actinokineospora sp. TaxID=1872133 RepID=UPI004037CBF8
MSDDDSLIAGRYRVIERLGSGGMGVVWRAYDERLHRTVAVKQLFMPETLSGPQLKEVKRRAMREGRIAAKLQHPHSITVFDVTEDDGRPYLIMEYLPSTSLSQRLAEHGTMGETEVAEIGSQVAAALAAAHAVGVVHRDVKPGNVLLGHDGTVKITDFGISRVVEDVTGTATADVGGTPAYLAPEVARGSRATFASDVFSLGATLYSAVEGVSPFGASDNAMALLYRSASGEITPPTQAGPVTDVLGRLLSVDSDSRPTMAEVRDMLASAAAWPLVAGEEVWSTMTLPAEPRHTSQVACARPESGPTGSGAQQATVSGAPGGGPSRKRRRLVVSVATAVLLLALAGTLFAANNGVSGRGSTAEQLPSSPTSPSATESGRPAEGRPPAALPVATTTVTTTTVVTTTAASPAAPVAPPGGPQTPQAAVIDYYALVPGNLQEGWTRLTPKYQRSPAGGYSGYQAFWNQMSGVRVPEATGTQGDTVEATVEYAFKDGRGLRERHRYSLVRQDGRWKIDESTVISSVSI